MFRSQGPKGEQLYQKYVTEQVELLELEQGIQTEYNRQQEYLEKTVEGMKRKIHKDAHDHRGDFMRVMQENVSLIKEIKARKTTSQTVKGQPSKKEGKQGDRELEHQRDIISQLRSKMSVQNKELEKLRTQQSSRGGRQALPPVGAVFN